jgi:hypothetical protein
MNRLQPIAAMVWEQWRLSRVEAVQRLGLGLLAASAVLVLKIDDGPTKALWILAAAHGFFWFSIAKLNGGRFMDGYKPGFPLYLLYPRPVSTVVFVAVAMAYDALSCAALYLVSALLLRIAFGQPFPLFSVAACLVAYHLASTCIQWSTRNRIVQWVGSMVIFWPLVILLKANMTAPLRVEFSFGDYALLALIGAVSFGLTVAGVARQRRGDAVATEPRKESWSGYPLWLVNLIRFRCPTSSATRAQLWFEMRASGLPVLTIGLGVAVLIFLLFAAGIAAPVREAAIGIPVLSVVLMLLLFGSNAFGIRAKQGRSYVSVFEATQPYATAQLAGLKVLVRTACVLVALFAIGASAWASSSLMGAWGASPMHGNDVAAHLLRQRRVLADFLMARPAHDIAAAIVVASIVVTVVIAWQAAREALKTRYPRRVIVAQWLPAAWGLAVGLLALAGNLGVLSDFAAGTSIMTAVWIATAGLATAAIYFWWSSLAGRVLTTRYLCVALLVLAAFALAYVTLLRSAGLPRAGTPWTAISILSWPVLLLLLGIALAPWSLNRVRHA